MCFSPEASFGASIGLTVIGAVAWKKADKTPLRLLAVIPFFFGIQQFFEGIVWVSQIHEEYASFSRFSTIAFILFAWVVWPLYLPFSLLKLEKGRQRKILLLLLGIIGVVVTAILIYIMVIIGVTAQVEDCSISYLFDYPYKHKWIFGVLYLSTTVLPNLISSTGKMWILGIVNFVTYFISKIYYDGHVISVWCFLAAISSIIILYVIIDLKRSKKF